MSGILLKPSFIREFFHVLSFFLFGKFYPKLFAQIIITGKLLETKFEMFHVYV